MSLNLSEGLLLAEKARKSQSKSVKFSSKASVCSQDDITQAFKSLTINKKRKSEAVKPTLKFLPTYQLESKNPFDPLVVKDIMKKIIDETMESLTEINFKTPEIPEYLSGAILDAVKEKNYDRYRILVEIDFGEKTHKPSRRHGLKCVWDSEKDSFASYVYERSNVFVIGTVFGVYYD